jgi:hypothetical protein
MAEESPERIDRFLDNGVRTEFCSKGRGLSRRQAGQLGSSMPRRFLQGSNVLFQSHYQHYTCGCNFRDYAVSWIFPAGFQSPRAERPQTPIAAYPP